MPEAAELMVYEGISLKEAVTQLNIALTSEECVNIARRASFKTLIRQIRNRLQTEIGSDPTRTKDTVVGQLQLLADQLEKQGDADKAAEVLFKIAKIRNWIGPEGTVNIFGDLTAKDYEKLRAEIQARKAARDSAPN